VGRDQALLQKDVITGKKKIINKKNWTLTTKASTGKGLAKRYPARLLAQLCRVQKLLFAVQDLTIWAISR
jgi:hypothetical protein